MDNEDRDRLKTVEIDVKYIRKTLDSLNCIQHHDDIESLKQTQKNIRRGTWATLVALISTGLTYLVKGTY